MVQVQTVDSCSLSVAVVFSDYKKWNSLYIEEPLVSVMNENQQDYLLEYPFLPKNDFGRQNKN